MSMNFYLLRAAFYLIIGPDFVKMNAIDGETERMLECMT